MPGSSMRILAIGGIVLSFMLMAAAGCSRSPASVSRLLSSSFDGLTAGATNHGAGGSEINLHAVEHSRTASASLKLDGVRIKQVLLAPLDGKPRLFALTSGADDDLRIYELRSGALRETWRGIPKRLNAWKVQVGDVDGDGNEDLAVGVYKKARFHPVMANRLFVYGWDGKDIYAKWLGSRLSRPFTDFVLADAGAGVKLVAIERTRDGADGLAVYRWDGFGFVGEWHGARSDKLSDLATSGSPGNQVISVTADGARRTYTYSESGLRLGGQAPR